MAQEFKDYNHSLIQFTNMTFDMKKVLFAFSALALLFFSGCKKDKPTVQVCPEGAVDMGIVMTRADGTTYKLFWAKSNLSSSGLCANETDYGDYYAWGETAPKNNYDWSTYKWCNGGNDKLTRYCPSDKADHWDGEGDPDDKAEFSDYDYADDAARARLGGKWRIPTEAEWAKLISECTWEITSDYNGTGVAGRIVTSNKNGNSIFLPAAGCRYDSNLYDAGSGGYYWSSSLYTGNLYGAWRVNFDSGNVSRYGSYRYYGFSVRPVSE